MTRLDRRDGWMIGGLGALVGVYAWLCLHPTTHPYEDAAMLMRYAKHLAEGHGIVWNVGEPPLDGATDFLFMVILAGLYKAGLTIETGVRAVGVASHLITVLLVYVAIRRLHGAGRGVAGASAAYLAIGPALGQVAGYFGAPFFALLAAVCWYQALRFARDKAGGASEWVFAASCLLMGLIRPEGVFLAVFMLIGVVYSLGITRARRVVRAFVWTVGLLGGVYFLWRWSYFGQPLPNPFYKKGGGTLHFWSLAVSIQYVLTMCLPFLPAFLVGFRSRESARVTLQTLIPVLGFTGIWILMSGEMNYMMRFQYPVLPMVLISWPEPVAGLAADWKLPTLRDLSRRNQRLSRVLAVTAGLLLLGYQQSIAPLERTGVYRDGKYDAAILLRKYADKGYTIATTEAGLLPFYSGWRAIDTWGLNDRWIAHHGAISERYLQARHPEIIMFHEFFSPIVETAGRGPWFEMVMTLKTFAESHGYRLAAVFGFSPYDTHSYYVRPDFKESSEIIRTIQQMEYFWPGAPRKAVDYAALAPCRNRRMDP